MSPSLEVSPILALDSLSLAFIASFLGGSELLQLIRCGSKDLNLKMSRSLHNITYSVSSPVYIRLSVIFAGLRLGCNRLKSFKLARTYPHIIQCLETNVDWNILGPSLEELYVSLDRTVPALATLNVYDSFPNLRTLYLSYLPADIDWQKPVFPPQLTSLQILSLLPHGIEQLWSQLPETIQLVQTWSICEWDQPTLPSLRHLTSLHTLRQALRFAELTADLDSCWSIFPPSITQLTATLSFGSRQNAVPPPTSWTALFPSLTQLYAHTGSIIDLDTHRIADFPTSLTSLTLGGRNLKSELAMSLLGPKIGSHIKALSMAVSSASSAAIKIEDLRLWPSLRVVRIASVEGETNDFDPSVLNSNTVNLYAPHMGSKDVEKLPSSIKYLEFATSAAQPFPTFNTLAANLSVLTITISASPYGFNLDILPTSLKKLALSVDDSASARITGSLQHLTRLTALSLGHDPLSNLFKLATPSQLPSSLERLDASSSLIWQPGFFGPDFAPHFAKLQHLDTGLAFMESSFNAMECIRWLPSSLKSFSGHCNRQVIWKEEHIKALPRSLTILRANHAGGWEGNTARALKHLPKTIAQLDIMLEFGSPYPDDYAYCLPVPLHSRTNENSAISSIYAGRLAEYEHTLEKKYAEEARTEPFLSH